MVSYFHDFLLQTSDLIRSVFVSDHIGLLGMYFCNTILQDFTQKCIYNVLNLHGIVYGI